MANSKIRGITIELSADASGVIESVKNIGKQIRSTKSQLKEVDNLLKLDPTNTELLEQKTALLKKQIGQTKEKLDALKTAQEDMDKNGVDKNSEQYQALQREIIATEQELKNLENTAGSGSATLAKISTVTGELGEKMTSAGKKMSVVSAGLVAFGTAAVKSFNEVDEGADIVIKKTGATGEAAEELQESYTNVAQSIVADFTDIGTAIGEVSTRFGLTGEDLEDLSTTFLKFAQINDIDVQTAVEGVDQALKTFNVDQSEANDFMGLLTATSQETGISMGELLSNLQQYGPALKEMGLDIDEAVVLMGNFEEAGIDSSDMLSKLQKAASYYNEQGLSMEEGLADLIERLQDSETEAEATAEAYELFGKRGGLAFVTAAKEGKLSIGDLETSMDDYSSVVDDTYQATLDGTDSMALAWQNLQIALAAVGDAIGTALAPIMENIVEILQEFVEWFTSLDESTQTTIVTIGLIVAAIGPLLLIIGKVLTAISSVTAALSTIGGTTFGPIGLVIAGIGALVLTFGALVEGWHNAALEASPFYEALNDIQEKNEELALSLENIKKNYEDSATGIDANAFAAQGLYDHLQDLMEAYDGTDEKQAEIRATVDSLNKVVPDLGLSWDGVTNSLSLTNDEILANIEAMRAQAQAAALQEMYVESLKAQYEAQENLATATATMDEILGKYGLTMEDVTIWTENGAAAGKYLSDKIAEATDEGFDFSVVMENCVDAVNGYNDAADNAAEATEDVNWAESELANIFADAANAVNDTGEAMEDMADDTKDAIDEIGDYAPEAEEAAGKVSKAVGDELDTIPVKAGEVGKVMTTNLNGSMLNEKKSVISTTSAVMSAGIAAMVQTIADKQPDVETAVSNVEAGMETSISPVEQAMTDAGDSSASNLDSSFGAWAATVEQTVTSMYNLFETIIGNSLVNEMTVWGASIGNSLNTAIMDATGTISSTIGTLAATITGGLSGMYDSTYMSGYYAGEGLYDGIAAWASALQTLVRTIANTISNTLRNALQISSPSKVMEKIGLFTGEGLEGGIEKSTAGIYSAIDSIADGMVNGIPTDIPMSLSGINANQSAAAEQERQQAAPSQELLTIVSMLSQYMPYLAEQTDIVLDDGTLAGHMAPKMNKALQALSTRAARG